jgi:serine/threonine protein kinase
VAGDPPAAHPLGRHQADPGGHLAGDPERRERTLRRFRREARTTASLQSSHTVRLFDYGVTEDGNALMVMEMIRGFDLQEIVYRFGPQPVDRAVAVLLAICDSLAEAHGRGLVHRDIKPANVKPCRQGRAVDHVKVLDFGSVAADPAAPEVSNQLTYTGTVFGTPPGLEITPPPGDDSDFTLTVTVRATEDANGDQATTVDTLQVTVEFPVFADGFESGDTSEWD